MDSITTTDLRTKTSQLVEMLKNGRSVSLLHRSKIVGVIQPKLKEKRTFDPSGFKHLAEEMNLPHMTYAQREKKYRKHLVEKYGKDLLRRKHRD